MSRALLHQGNRQGLQREMSAVLGSDSPPDDEPQKQVEDRTSLDKVDTSE